MHILLTDQLACPRCGPEFGLIVLADRIADRRVESGTLGCANCRTGYPVEAGVADLRVEGSTLFFSPDPSVSEPEYALRLAALIGVQPPQTWVVVIDGSGAAAPAVSGYLPDARIVSITPGPAVPASAAPVQASPAPAQAADRVSKVFAGERMPFRSGGFRAVVVAGAPAPDLLRELGRLPGRGGRLVVTGGDDETVKILHEMGFTMLLREADTLVAAAPGGR
ncbi:MAG: hypothetical protein LBG44_04190 [Gemmatimonadota bacterium]|nr:hypothetical protein [Gemmatimonadota bacterium]